jgi:hypothetical protein
MVYSIASSTQNKVGGNIVYRYSFYNNLDEFILDLIPDDYGKYEIRYIKEGKIKNYSSLRGFLSDFLDVNSKDIDIFTKGQEKFDRASLSELINLSSVVDFICVD